MYVCMCDRHSYANVVFKKEKMKLNFILFHQNLTQVVEIYNHIDQAVVKMNLKSEEELEKVLFVFWLLMTVPRSGYWKAALCLRCQDILKEISNFIYLMKAEQTVYQLKDDLSCQSNNTWPKKTFTRNRERQLIRKMPILWALLNNHFNHLQYCMRPTVVSVIFKRRLMKRDC